MPMIMSHNKFLATHYAVRMVSIVHQTTMGRVIYEKDGKFQAEFKSVIRNIERVKPYTLPDKKLQKLTNI